MKTTYVLGAGASIGSDRRPKTEQTAALGMPSGTKFFRDVFHQAEMTQHSERFVDGLRLSYPVTHELLSDLFGIPDDDTSGWLDLNVEDVFSLVDIAVASKPNGTQDLRFFRQVRRNLIDFVWIEILFRCRWQYCGHLERLFRTLSPHDSVLSFNWDTLADATLDRLDAPQFESYVSLMEDTEYQPEGGTLLKLHGSVNWYHCPNPSCRSYREIALECERNGAIGKRLRWSLSGDTRCQRCKARLQVALVPPTSRKLVTRGTRFHGLWLTAEQQLEDTDRLVIIGYSLPRADVYAEWLFRQINVLKGGALQVLIVDPMTADPDSDLMRRFRSVFHGATMGQTYLDLAAFVSQVGG